MDLILITALMRALERLLAIGAGLLSIYLGFRLFLALPEVEPGAGRIKLPGGVSIYLTRVGPGVFFSLFGSVIIALSFYFGVTATEVRNGPAGESQLAGGPAVGTQRSFTGATLEGAGADAAGREVERATVARLVHDLNRIPALLRADLSPRDRALIQTLDQAKVRLMRAVWDAEAWGDYTAFERWWRAGGVGEPAAETAAAVAVFRAGGNPP